MNSSAERALKIVVTGITFITALLGVLVIFDLLSFDEVVDNVAKLAAAGLIVVVATTIISMMNSK